MNIESILNSRIKDQTLVAIQDQNNEDIETAYRRATEGVPTRFASIRHLSTGVLSLMAEVSNLYEPIRRFVSQPEVQESILKGTKGASMGEFLAQYVGKDTAKSYAMIVEASDRFNTELTAIAAKALLTGKSPKEVIADPGLAGPALIEAYGGIENYERAEVEKIESMEGLVSRIAAVQLLPIRMLVQEKLRETANEEDYASLKEPLDSLAKLAEEYTHEVGRFGSALMREYASIIAARSEAYRASVLN